MRGFWSVEHNLNIHRGQVTKKKNSSLNMGHIEDIRKKRKKKITQWYQVKADVVLI